MIFAKVCLKLYLPVPRLWALVPALDYNLVLAAAAGWREGDSNQLKLVSPHNPTINLGWKSVYGNFLLKQLYSGSPKAGGWVYL